MDPLAKPHVRNRISPIDRARIRVVSGCDEQTIRKYPAVSNASARRIESAASQLAIALPNAVTTDSNPPPRAA